MLSRRARIALDTLLPSNANGSLPAGLFDAGFEAFFDEFERTSVPALRWSFQAALFTALWIAPLLIGRLPPISRLDRPAREQALNALGASRSYLLRQMLLVLKTTVSFSYGANPGVRAAIGYGARPGDESRPVAS